MATQEGAQRDPRSFRSLADRCEQAAGADRRLDGLIFAHLNSDKRIIIGSEPGRFPQKAIYGTPLDMLEMLEGTDRMAGDAAEYLSAPTYTASLDAAMTLVPEGWRAIIDTASEESVALVDLWALPVAAPKPKRRHAKAATASLALCAAALKARAASGIETRSATDAKRRGPEGESPTAAPSGGDAQPISGGG